MPERHATSHRTADRRWVAAAIAAVRALDQRVFAPRELQQVLETLRTAGTIPKRTSLASLIDALSDAGELREWDIGSISGESATSDQAHGPYRPFRRYTWGDASPLEVALSLRPRSYLSHATAMALHGLSAPGERAVYVNQEQSAKPVSTGSLAQAAIDRAFQNRARTSRYVFRYGTAELVLLNGKQSGNRGVIPMPSESGVGYPTTDVERTLIDITVRPAYAGGTVAVLEAYRRARRRLSLPALVDTLVHLAFVYPYHQAIGFYLERAGATPQETAPLRALGLEYDFYLAHQMEQPAYDPTWRVYYPRHLV